VTGEGIASAYVYFKYSAYRCIRNFQERLFSAGVEGLARDGWTATWPNACIPSISPVTRFYFHYIVMILIISKSKIKVHILRQLVFTEASKFFQAITCHSEPSIIFIAIPFSVVETVAKFISLILTYKV
jgi:hypothetical protein